MSYNLTTLVEYLQATPSLDDAVNAGNDNAVLVALTANSETLVNVASIPKGTFLLKIVAPARVAIAMISDAPTKAALAAFYDPIIQIIIGADSDISVDSFVTTLLAQVVSQGLLTQGAIDVVTKRTATVFETLYGAGAVPSLDFVSQATRAVRAAL